MTGVGLIVWYGVNPIRAGDTDGIFTPDVADKPAPKWADARHFEGANRGVASAPSGGDKGFDETSVFTFRIKTINHHHLVGFGNFDVIRKGVGAVNYDGEGLSGGVLSLVGGGNFNFIIANFGKIGLRVNLTLDLIVDIINTAKERARGGATLLTDKLTGKQNEKLTATVRGLGTGYEGKTVEFWIYSKPVKLGEGIVKNGEATVTALIPCKVQPGEHTVTARIDGVDVGEPVTVEVIEAPDCATEEAKEEVEEKKSFNNWILIIAAVVVVLLAGAIAAKRKQK